MKLGFLVRLKRQVPRLRDWNSTTRRGKGFGFSPWNDKYLDYEIETDDMTTQNPSSIGTWNDKYLDYEIETKWKKPWSKSPGFTWNDKYLDYEIETLRIVAHVVFPLCLETTSTSITRLKRNWSIACRYYCRLETTSTSITRLKLHVLHHVGCNVFTWNDKYLDYEIETSNHQRDVFLYTPWNDKYLDYEIETASQEPLLCQPLTLKRQVPRLRDWNCRCGTDNSWIVDKLETTSTSITRLKLDGYHYPLQYSALTWNDKYLDYEIETSSLSHLKWRV